jgi:hypothetical protein
MKGGEPRSKVNFSRKGCCEFWEAAPHARPLVDNRSSARRFGVVYLVDRWAFGLRPSAWLGIRRGWLHAAFFLIPIGGPVVALSLLADIKQIQTKSTWSWTLWPVVIVLGVTMTAVIGFIVLLVGNLLLHKSAK